MQHSPQYMVPLCNTIPIPQQSNITVERQLVLTLTCCAANTGYFPEHKVSALMFDMHYYNICFTSWLPLMCWFNSVAIFIADKTNCEADSKYIMDYDRAHHISCYFTGKTILPLNTPTHKHKQTSPVQMMCDPKIIHFLVC